MEKLTLSIKDKAKIAWIKNFAKAQDTSVSRLFEKYVDALRNFDQTEVNVSSQLQALRQPGKRPTDKQIENYLKQRRHRTSPKKNNE